jgi:ferredoxin--NADP+ reductase/benzoate/toluate 1,2-dioxygenase reductase subunit
MLEFPSIPTSKLRLAVELLNESYLIHEIIHLQGNAFILRFERNNFIFKPGQHIQLTLKGNFNYREYSIYSGFNDRYLEILVKEVDNGYLSNKLGKCKPGDKLEIHGPFGQFKIKDKDISKPFLFVASGTGIAPFHSIIGSNPNLNYTLLHGVKYNFVGYERDFYDPKRYVLCTSRDEQGNFNGRVTGYLNENVFDPESEIYLCGNNQMIFDAVKILNQKGFKREQIHTEVYF